MRRTEKARFLARMAKRYALRHRGQTTRAVLGLVVVTIVLTVGLGLGQSIAVSLEETALAEYGPVDVVVRGPRPYAATVVDGLLSDPTVRAEGTRGVGVLVLTGSAANPRTDLAEAFAALRGAAPGEDRVLGPLRAPDGTVVPEPRPGEVVLSASLAERLGARVGDALVFRSPDTGDLDDLPLARFNLTGATGTPLATTTVEVGEDALGLGVGVAWADAAGPLAVEARGPSGVAFGNTSAASPVILFVEPPLETGTWTITVSSGSPFPVAYTGQGAVAYPPPSLSAGAVEIPATVSGIAADGGRVGISFRPVAVLPLSDLQNAAGARGLVSHGYFRVQGDARAVEQAMIDRLPDDVDAEVAAAKLDAIEEAREAGAEITGFLIGMGGFTLVAAILLAYALFSALVGERRVELGISRALGLTRGEVAFGMTVEGALYAAAAALVGLALGLAMLFALVSGISSVSAAEGGPDFDVHLAPTTLLVAFVGGTLVPLLTIGLASLRFARLDPSRAIRGIPDDPKGRRRAGLFAAGAVAVVGVLLSFGPYGRLVGLPLALAGVAIGLNALKRPRLALAAAAAGVALVLYTLYAWDTWPDEMGELDPILTLARGAVLALGVAALLVASTAPYDALARLVGRRKGAPRAGFVALRYLVSRRVPAGLTIGMISLVVVVVTVMGTLMLLFSAQIPTEEAGYAVVGESPLRLDALPRALPADVARQVERLDRLDRHFEFAEPNVTKGGVRVETPWWFEAFYGVTPQFAEGNTYEMRARDPRYATDREAWDAVARGEAIVIPDLIGGDGVDTVLVGDTITFATALGRPTEVVVAGSVRSNYAFGVFAASDRVRAMGFPLGSLFLVRVVDGADPDPVAHRLTSEFAGDGVTFLSVPEEAERFVAATRAAILVFESFLALGLFVGLAATGFLASRAVHERIRDIGTLRALGFEERDVRRAFVVESVATAALGLLVGVVVGTLVAHSVWWREIREAEIPFRPPWLLVLGFSAVVLALAALAARGPAVRAARLPPALAVRHVE